MTKIKIINSCHECDSCVNKTIRGKIMLVCTENNDAEIKDSDKIAAFCELEDE